MAGYTTVVGYDDRAVDRGLRGLDRKFSIAGDRIDRATSGSRKLVGAMGSAVGLASGVGAIAVGIGFALKKVVDGLNYMNQHGARSLQLATQTRREYEALGRMLDGLSGPGPSKFDQKRLEITEKIRDLEVAIAFERSKLTGASEALGGMVAQRNTLEEMLARVDELEEIERKRALTQRWIASQVAQENALRDSSIDLLRASGDEIGAMRAEEQKRYQEALRAISEIDGLTRQNYLELRDQAEQIHRARMRQIEEEADARRRAEEERKRAEEEARRREQEHADDLQRRIEIDLAAARGDKDREQQLRREEELERRIRDIRDAKGLSDDERQRLIDKAREIDRLAALSAGRPMEDRSETITLRAGAGGGELLRAQTFGSNRTAADFDRQKREQEIANNIARLRQLAERMLGAPERSA